MKFFFTSLLLFLIINVKGQDTNGIKITYVSLDTNFKFTVIAFKNLALHEQIGKYAPPIEESISSSVNGQKQEAQKTKRMGKEVDVYNYTYTDFNRHLSFTTENVGWDKNPFLVTDTIDIEWKLIDEKKKIDKMECYKAEADFKGRKYTAWYAPEISIPIGPWKLVGLPGLVMEVSDTENLLNFSVVKIEWLEGGYDVKLPKSSLKNITWLTYKKLWNDWMKTKLKAINTSADPNVELKGTININLPEKSIFQ